MIVGNISVDAQLHKTRWFVPLLKDDQAWFYIAFPVAKDELLWAVLVISHTGTMLNSTNLPAAAIAINCNHGYWLETVDNPAMYMALCDPEKHLTFANG